MGYYFQNTDEKSITAVWNKGRIIDGYDPNQWRRDICGNVLRYEDHGKTTKYGWEIDHIVPASKGGTNYLSNLQPLYWSTNRSKGDRYPWRCELNI